MQKRRRLVTSVTIDRADKKKADELHINYSEAFEKGLKYMFAITEMENDGKKKLMKQETKVKKLKAKIKLQDNIIKSMNDIEKEYNEITLLSSKVDNNKHKDALIEEYMNEFIKFKAMRLLVPSDKLKDMFNDILKKKDEVKPCISK